MEAASAGQGTETRSAPRIQSDRELGKGIFLSPPWGLWESAGQRAADSEAQGIYDWAGSSLAFLDSAMTLASRSRGMSS
jgi:hypothetical protein